MINRSNSSDESRRTNYYDLLLSGNVELNPGPSVVDPTRTIAAPYSQSNRRVARSFCGGGGVRLGSGDINL